MDLRKKIKGILLESELTMSDLVNIINKEYFRHDTVQNLSNKLTRGTLKYREVEEIVSILGYELIWKEK